MGEHPTTCQRPTTLKSPKPPVTLLASPAMALKLVDTALPMALFAVADSDMATLAPTNPMAMAILVPDTEATELAITEDLPEQAMREEPATTVKQSMEECNKFTE